MNFFGSKINRPVLVMIFMGFFLALTMLVLAFVTNQSADVVIGHATLNQNGINGQDPFSHTLHIPSSVYTDGTKLYIADGGNHPQDPLSAADKQSSPLLMLQVPFPACC